jgi:hypothetical protein
MPVKNPSAELLEAIRLHGICKETGVTAQWGYHAKDEPRVFLLEKGEALPKGWSPMPVVEAVAAAPKSE